MRRVIVLLVAAGLALAACSSSTKGKSATNTTAAEQSPNTTAAKQSPNATVQTTGEGIHKIQHIVMIMQENHSFDQYFGTYPGADGIPMKDGEPTVCVPDPKAGTCQKPYHDTDDVNRGGPHGKDAVIKDVNDGKMDGFIAAAQQSGDARCANDPNLPDCVRVGEIDVMGYHTRDELGNYWTYADNYVLHDHMFEPIASWSLPSHLMMVSGWSAKCKIPSDPTSCINEPDNPNSITDGARPPAKPQKRPHYAWTDITYLLHQNHVSWNYYIAEGTQPDCDDDQPTCQAKPQVIGTPQIWNPLPYFDTVKANGELGNIKKSGEFYDAAKLGQLPAVSWVIPNARLSEHYTSIRLGQAYVTSVINAVMASPNWNSTAIFLAWDDWGGFYDHVPPPKIDENGYGMRVPSLVISPYAKKGFIDHQTLSFDAYLKFIEDVFLNGQRLDPKTDGRPDPRPTVRESVPQLGDLANDFDFNQPPRPPMKLKGAQRELPPASQGSPATGPLEPTTTGP